MKFKRILATAFSLALILPLLILWAQAHPGRTDEDGGHHVGGTGEYHWHHGEGPHEHIDLDGDEVLDCTLNTPEHLIHELLWGLLVLFCLCGFPFLSLLLMEAYGRLRRFGRTALSDFIGVLAVFIGICNPIGAFIVHFLFGDILQPRVDRLLGRLFRQKVVKPPPEPSSPTPEKLCLTPILNQQYDRHRKFCGFLWRKSPALLKAVGIPLTYANSGRVFGALFYVAVRVMRSKPFSDGIFRLLPDVIAESAPGLDDRYIGAVIRSYCQIAPELNSSGIDPLTPDGQSALWSFLLDRLSFDSPPVSDASDIFARVIDVIIRNAQSFKTHASSDYSDTQSSKIPT